MSILPSLHWATVTLGLVLGTAMTFAAEAPTAPLSGKPPPSTAVFTFKRGVSIGHWMAKMHDGQPYGAAWFGPDDVEWIARQGFDHVRIPVDGRLWLRANGSLDPVKIDRFLEAVEWAHRRGLGTVLDMHFLPGAAGDDPNEQDPAIYTDAAARAKAGRFWRSVARRFSAEGPWLRFELINEPFAPVNEQLNELERALLAAVRSADRERIVYVTTNRSSSFATLADAWIPPDSRVAIVVHYDEPSVFTHQRASWKHFPATMPVVRFPGRVPDLSRILPPGHDALKMSGVKLTVKTIDTDFARVAAWLRQQAPGKEIYLGEFGCYEAAPAESRRTYISTVRRAAEREGWGWAVWDYRSSFAVRDSRGQPTAVLSGLFDR